MTKMLINTTNPCITGIIVTKLLAKAAAVVNDVISIAPAARFQAFSIRLSKVSFGFCWRNASINTYISSTPIPNMM